MRNDEPDEQALIRGFARPVGRVLAAGVAVLSGLGALTAVNLHVLKPRGLDVFVDGLFHLDREPSVPTWWSAGVLALAAAACGAAWRAGRGERRSWFWAVLAAAFAGLSVDEVAMLHETFGGALAAKLPGPAGGLLTYRWILVGGPVAGLFAAAAVPFLLALPRQTAGGLALAGGLFVGGAVGVEALNGRAAAAVGADSLRYALGTVVEEVLEMAGAALAVVVALRYAERLRGPLELRFAPPPEATGRD